jgi:hypothetical protein
MAKKLILSGDESLIVRLAKLRLAQKKKAS